MLARPARAALWSDHQTDIDVIAGAQRPSSPSTSHPGAIVITGMNHAVLYVRDARRQEQFYRDVLGFSTVIEGPDGAFVFMRAPASVNHHDIAFFTIGHGAGPSAAGRGTVGMYHVAWEVATLDELAAVQRKLADAGALVGASDHGANKSVYAKDPDGLEFEVMWLVPPDEWGDEENEAIIRPLDIGADIERFGAHTPSASRLDARSGEGRS